MAAQLPRNRHVIATPLQTAQSMLLLVTEWKVYRAADFMRLRQRLRALLVIDGRNQYDPQAMSRLGYEYCGVGRGLARPSRSAGVVWQRAALLTAG